MTTPFRYIIIIIGVIGCSVYGCLEPAFGQMETWRVFERDVFRVVKSVVEQQDNPAGDPQALTASITSLMTRQQQFVQSRQCPSQDTCYSYQRILESSQRILTHDTGQSNSIDEWECLAILRQAYDAFDEWGGYTPPQPTEALFQNAPETTGADPLAPQNPIEMNVSYRYLKNGMGEVQALGEGSTIRSGDHYQIAFEVQEDSYVYVFQIDGAGKMFSLFPLQSFQGVSIGEDNPVQSGKTYAAPSPEQWFVLDEQTGPEAIYVLAFRERPEQLEQLSQQMRQAQNSNNPILEAEFRQQVQDFVHKGVARVTPRGDIVDELRNQQVELCDGCVHILKFQHQ